MNNLVKLVQASGKALVLPAETIAIVRTLEKAEREKHPRCKAGVWLILNGVAQHVMVHESFGFILKKAGGASSGRVQLTGMGGTKVSMPRTAFGHAIESERVERDAQGKETAREDATILNTNLHSGAGAVAFYVKESAEDLHDLLSADESDDDGADDEDEDDEEPAEIAAAA